MSSKISDVVKRTFTESFTARDIAEPLASFDEGTSSEDVRNFMEAKGVEIVYTGSFSKILGPGFRLGYMLCSPEIFDKAETIKQALDACTSNFNQILANEFMVQGKLAPYLTFLRKEYAERKTLLLTCLKNYMPDGVRWNEPKGGFYVWLTLPENMLSVDVFKESVKHGVVFVTGRTFDPAGEKDNCLRLAF